MSAPPELIEAARRYRARQLCPRCGRGEVTTSLGLCRECADVREALEEGAWDAVPDS